MAVAKEANSGNPEKRIAACLKGHEPPKIPFILKSLSINEHKVLCIYVVGSHLWSCCNPKSDWDLVVITNEDKSKAVNAHKGNIDAWIVPVEEYSIYIRDHLIQALLTIWIPEKLVLLKKETFDPVKMFTYSKVLMSAAVDKLYERDKRVAAKHFSKGDYNAGVKIVKHLLRQLGLCVQIMQFGSIHDYTCNEDTAILHTLSWEEIEHVMLSKKQYIFAIS